MEEYLSEKEQWEQVKAWLRDNGLWIIAGIVVGARWLSAAGTGTRTTSIASAREASTKYTQMLWRPSERVTGRRRLCSSASSSATISSSPYVDQGKLMAARVYVDSGDLDKAAS